MSLLQNDPSEVVDSIVRSLTARLGESVAVDAIRTEVRNELAAYSTARVTQFVPILVESHVRTRLQAGSAALRPDSPKGTRGRG